MLSATSAVLIAATFFFVYLCSKFIFKRHGKCTVPAGPRGHWLVGNARIPSSDLCERLFAWRQSHGPIFEFNLFPGYPLFIIVNDVKLAKEMFMNKDFASRETTNNVAIKVMNPTLSGIIMQSWSPTWKELHKFTMTTLSAMGFGRVRMEDKVVAEADALIQAMLNTKGAPFDPEPFLRGAVTNVIGNIMLSERSEIGQYSKLHANMKSFVESFVQILLDPVYTSAPVLTKIYKTQTMKTALGSKDFVEKFIEASLLQHEKTINPEEPRDLLDAFIIERRRQPQPHFSDINVLQSILDMFIAGSDTTSITLLWIIAFLIRYPEVKRNLLAEIKNVFGMEVAPSIIALNQFNYVQAFMDEVYRVSSVAFLGVLHRPSVPVAKLGGYDITDNKSIAINIWGIHHDPNLWEESMEFRPERFLDANGKYKKNDNLMPFGIGTRRCVGEKLARLEIFVFTVRLLQRIDFQLAAGCEMPALKGRVEGLRAPEFYKVTAKAMDY